MSTSSVYEGTKSIFESDLKVNNIINDAGLSTSKEISSNPLQNDPIKESTLQNYLKPTDYVSDISTSFLYENIIVNLETPQSIIQEELARCDLNRSNHYNIYKAASILEMVEISYNHNYYLKEQMTKEICYLLKVIHKYRRVAGDGNCFYRSAIFGWLEYLIFNQKIEEFKKIIVDLHTKFNPLNEKIKVLKDNIKKVFLNLDVENVIVILEIIISQLNNNANSPTKRIFDAYTTLIKAFNYSKLFDMTMILYLRFILYEYIKDNENKTFSNDFPVLIGNLLPYQFQTEKGEFFFDNYYNNDLLRFYTCAEKLAIYLTPIVLRINLKVFIYDYGKECDIQYKTFSCFNKSIKDTIAVLYRKCHYDICYENSYWKKYENYFQLYKNLNDNNQIVSQKEIDEMDKQIGEMDFMNQTKIYNYKGLPVQNDNNVLIQSQDDTIPVTSNQDNNNKANVDENEEEESAENMLVSERLVMAISKINEIKRCLECNKFLPKLDSEKYKNELPCGCPLAFCSYNCKNNYLSKVKAPLRGDLLDKSNQFICFHCMKSYNRAMYIKLILLFSEYLSEKLLKCEAIKSFLEIFSKNCMNCLKKVENLNNKVLCKNEMIGLLLGQQKFEHYLCNECRNKKVSECNLCECYHFRIAKGLIRSKFIFNAN